MLFSVKEERGNKDWTVDFSHKNKAGNKQRKLFFSAAPIFFPLENWGFLITKNKIKIKCRVFSQEFRLLSLRKERGKELKTLRTV